MKYNFTKKNIFHTCVEKMCKEMGFAHDPDNPIISTKGLGGKYCIEFCNSHTPYLFNKVATTKKLEKSPHYPKSWIIANVEQFNTLLPQLDKNTHYFVKPQYGCKSENISLLKGDSIIFNNGIGKYPAAVQEEIRPKLRDGYKIDYRIYVLYVKNANKITAYYYPIGPSRQCAEKMTEQRTENNCLTQRNIIRGKINIDDFGTRIVSCLENAQKFIIPKINAKNVCEVEICFVGYDVIEDMAGKFWIIEINAVPNLYHYHDFIKFQREMIQDIINMFSHYDASKKIKFSHFKKL